jgi:hypothetical protein
MVALNERLPDAYKLLPPARQPDPGEGSAVRCGRWSPAARAARTSRHAGPPPSGLAEWLADRQQQADQDATRRHAGAVAERRVAEALRAWAIDREPTADRQEHGDPPAEPADRERDRQGEERDREPDDFGDSWQTYRERADHIRRAYGWTVPEPPPRAENWPPLGHNDDWEHGEPPDRSRRLSGEERDRDREDH